MGAAERLWIGLWTGTELGQPWSNENAAKRVLAAAFCAILSRMRVGLFIISAFSASAGVAVAQSDWVVDPWSSHATTPPEQSSIATLADAAHPALEPRRAYNQHREWLNEWSAEPADPWTGDAATAPGLAHPPAEPVLERATRDSGDWAKPVPLLVDPWATEPARSAAPVVDLIVDPWAHE